VEYASCGFWAWCPTTLWLFREHLTRAGAITTLFARVRCSPTRVIWRCRAKS